MHSWWWGNDFVVRLDKRNGRDVLVMGSEEILPSHKLDNRVRDQPSLCVRVQQFLCTFKSASKRRHTILVNIEFLNETLGVADRALQIETRV